MSALAVYRDLLLSRGFVAEAAAPAWLLLEGQRTADGPEARALLAELRREVYGWLEPEHIVQLLDEHAPRATVRRLYRREVARSVARHVEGLRVAVSLGIDPAEVHTLIQPFDTGIADRVTITKVDQVDVERAKVRGKLRPSDTRIPLPNGWQRAMRGPHRAPPWHPDPPEGWQISGHGRWLWRRPDPEQLDLTAGAEEGT